MNTVNSTNLFRATMLGLGISAMLQLAMDALGKIPKAMIAIRKFSRLLFLYSLPHLRLPGWLQFAR